MFTTKTTNTMPSEKKPGGKNFKVWYWTVGIGAVSMALLVAFIWVVPLVTEEPAPSKVKIAVEPVYLDCGATISESATLAGDLVCDPNTTPTALTIVGENVTLNADGHKITFSSYAPGTVGIRVQGEKAVIKNFGNKETEEVGIANADKAIVLAASKVFIKDNVLEARSAAGGVSNETAASKIFIRSNKIELVQSGAVGIKLSGATSSQIVQNVIGGTGGTSETVGVVLQGSSSNAVKINTFNYLANPIALESSSSNKLYGNQLVEIAWASDWVGMDFSNSDSNDVLYNKFEFWAVGEHQEYYVRLDSASEGNKIMRNDFTVGHGVDLAAADSNNNIFCDDANAGNWYSGWSSDNPDYEGLFLPGKVPSCSPSLAIWRVDDDYDLAYDSDDNCPGIPNSSQEDLDGDGIGARCDDNEFDLSLESWMNGFVASSRLLSSYGDEWGVYYDKSTPSMVFRPAPLAYKAFDVSFQYDSSMEFNGWDEAGVGWKKQEVGKEYLVMGPASLVGTGTAFGYDKKATHYYKLQAQTGEPLKVSVDFYAPPPSPSGLGYYAEDRGLEGIVLSLGPLKVAYCSDPPQLPCYHQRLGMMLGETGSIRISKAVYATSGERIETANPNFLSDCQSLVTESGEGERQGALDACQYNYMEAGINTKAKEGNWLLTDLGGGNWRIEGSIDPVWLAGLDSNGNPNVPDLLTCLNGGSPVPCDDPSKTGTRVATFDDLNSLDDSYFEEGTYSSVSFLTTLAYEDLIAIGKKFDGYELLGYTYDPSLDDGLPNWKGTPENRKEMHLGSYVPVNFTSLAVKDADLVWHTEKTHELYPFDRSLDYSKARTNRQGMTAMGYLKLENSNQDRAAHPEAKPIEANLLAGPYSKVEIVNSELKGGASGIIAGLNNLKVSGSYIETVPRDTQVENEYQEDFTAGIAYVTTDTIYAKVGTDQRDIELQALDGLYDPLSAAGYGSYISRYDLQPKLLIENSTIMADEVLGIGVLSDGNADGTPIKITGNTVNARGNLFGGLGQDPTKLASMEITGNTFHTKGNIIAGNLDSVKVANNTFNGYSATEKGGSGPALMIAMSGKQFAEENLGFVDPITYQAFSESKINQLIIEDTVIQNHGTMSSTYTWVDNSIAVHEAPVDDPDYSAGKVTFTRVTADKPVAIYGDLDIASDGSVVIEGKAAILARVTANDVSGTGAATGQQPLAGAEVRAFDRSDLCVAANFPDGQDVWTNCSARSACTTATNGECTMSVNPGDYFVVASEVTRAGKYPSHAIGYVAEGQTKLARLAFLKTPDGSEKPGKTSSKSGSTLWLYEPAYVVWESEQAYYPFVFESDSNWTIDVCVDSPAGYVPADGVPCVQTLVPGEARSILFKLVEVGSVPGKAKVHMKLKGPNGKIQSHESDIEPRLTPAFAKKKGVEVDKNGRMPKFKGSFLQF